MSMGSFRISCFRHWHRPWRHKTTRYKS